LVVDKRFKLYAQLVIIEVESHFTKEMIAKLNDTPALHSIDIEPQGALDRGSAASATVFAHAFL
jgi:hypothetical protein